MRSRTESIRWRAKLSKINPPTKNRRLVYFLTRWRASEKLMTRKGYLAERHFARVLKYYAERAGRRCAGRWVVPGWTNNPKMGENTSWRRPGHDLEVVLRAACTTPSPHRLIY